jgi:hypothetical protein
MAVGPIGPGRLFVVVLAGLAFSDDAYGLGMIAKRRFWLYSGDPASFERIALTSWQTF